MSQAEVTRLVSKIRYGLRDRRNLKGPLGPKGRHDKIRKVVTALFKHERIELNFNRADEARGYAERLISDAIRHGDCHRPTMEMASYWLLEPQLVHKLFKVLAPRYQNCPLSYTKSWRAPYQYPGKKLAKCVLELRNNIYPPLGPDKTNHKNLIHNVLLLEAKRAYLKEKAIKLGKFLSPEETAAASVGQQSAVSESVSPVLDENKSSEPLAMSDTTEKSEEKESGTVKMSVGKKEGLTMSETNEKVLNEEKESGNVKMSGAKGEDLTSKENVESSSSIDKELNLDKMKITESEEEKPSSKEK